MLNFILILQEFSNSQDDFEVIRTNFQYLATLLKNMVFICQIWREREDELEGSVYSTEIVLRTWEGYQARNQFSKIEICIKKI